MLQLTKAEVAIIGGQQGHRVGIASGQLWINTNHRANTKIDPCTYGNAKNTRPLLTPCWSVRHMTPLHCEHPHKARLQIPTAPTSVSLTTLRVRIKATKIRTDCTDYGALII